MNVDKKQNNWNWHTKSWTKSLFDINKKINKISVLDLESI